VSGEVQPSWLTAAGTAWLLTLHVQPGAKVTVIQGRHGDALKIRLAAPPVDGKANTELVRFLADALQVPRSAVELIAGQTSRQKRVRIASALPRDAMMSALWDDERLGPLA
jgi:uncharacterized protein